MAKLLKTRATEENVVGEFKKLSEKEAGLLLVIDEMGKYLEADCATENAYLLQELAETANRTRKKVVLVGILHQAVDVYASRMPRQVRDEWEKVRGRFSDIPLLGSAEEVLQLLGRAIEAKPHDKDSIQRVSEVVANEYAARRAGGMSRKDRLQKLLDAAWPLNPVLSLLLGPISRRKFSQNERSIYSFLNSREPQAFQEFLDLHSEDDLYSPADYWDYMRANYEPSILSTSDGHRWIVAVDAVERTERKGTSEHIRLVKTLALVDLFRTGSGIEASLPILAVGSGFDESKTKALLKDLQDWKVAIARHHVNAFAVFEGSDFNLDQAVAEALAQQNGIDVSLIDRLLALQPVIARNLYMRLGTLRWFTRVVVPYEQLKQWRQTKHVDDGETGTFVLVIPEDGEERTASDLVAQLTSDDKVEGTQDFPVVFGVPEKWQLIRSMCLELQALHIVEKAPELEGDEAGRKEVAARLMQTRDQLIEMLSGAFSHAVWKHKAVGERFVKKQSEITEIASNVADAIYESTPVIRNELINRDYLSSNVASARKSLMNRMLVHSTERELGYEKFPPDYTLYLSLLKTLHKKNNSGVWYFSTQGTPERYGDFWSKTEAHLKTCGVTKLVELYDFWRKAPFGLRMGPMPVLALVYYLANKDQVAVYQNQAFISEVTPETIDLWLVDPKAISFRVFENSVRNKSFIEKMADLMEQISSENCEGKPLTVARALVKFFLSSPKLSQHSTNYTPKTNQLKQTILKASDPIKLLVDDIPNIYGVEDIDVLVSDVAKSIQEYSTSMPAVIRATSDILRKALKYVGPDWQALRERAASVKGLSGKMLLEAFIARLEKFNGEDADVEGLLGLAAAKPSFMWTDNDINVALSKLVELSYEFRRLEAGASLRGRKTQTRTFNVVFAGADNEDLNQEFEISEDDSQKAKKIAENIRQILGGANNVVAMAALTEAGLGIVNEAKRGQ